jgi:hypothetical protein
MGGSIIELVWALLWIKNCSIPDRREGLVSPEEAPFTGTTCQNFCFSSSTGVRVFCSPDFSRLKSARSAGRILNRSPLSLGATTEFRFNFKHLLCERTSMNGPSASSCWYDRTCFGRPLGDWSIVIYFYRLYSDKVLFCVSLNHGQDRPEGPCYAEVGHQ